MLAYGKIPWDRKGGPGYWPLIGLAPQKQHLSLYIAGQKQGQGIVEWYGNRLGSTSNGKGCIRFTSIAKLDLEVLKELLLDVKNGSLPKGVDKS